LTYGSFTTGWHTVYVSQNGTSATMYVDGVSVATGTVNSGTGTWAFDIGRLTASLYWLNGSFMRFQAFGTSLTGDQVKFLHNSLVGRYPYAFRRSLLQACGVHAYYDGTFSGANAYDVVGGLGTKTISGTMPTSVRAQQNKAYAPTGSQAISFGTTNLYDATGWWVGQWVKYTSASTMANEFNNVGNYRFALYYVSGVPNAFYRTSAPADVFCPASKAYNDDKWHFCIAEFIPGVHQRIWVDGHLENTVSIVGVSWNAEPGQRVFSTRDSPTSYFSGKADFMYGKGPMTSAKAQALYFGTYRN
jgi:hypothetical protein